MTIDLNTILTNALNAAIEQATAPLRERIAMLEALDTASATRLDDLERKLDNLTEREDTHIRAIAEAVLAEHTEEYDHDAFLTDESDLTEQVSKVLETYDFDDIVDDLVEPAVRRALRSATVTIDL
jgi:hypothetical protein